MLSPEKALDYVTSTLGVKDAERRVDTDGLGLVNEIIRKFHNKVPFHNIHLMSLKEEERKVPTVEENIEFVMSGLGGLGWTLNSFMYCLLKALGYRALVLVGSTIRQGKNNHMITLLRHVVNEGDRYLAEAGFGTPCFRAIPFNFKDESETFQDSYLYYKYINNHGSYTRVEKTVTRFKQEKATGVPAEWPEKLWFDLDPVDLDFIQDCMRPIYVTRSIGVYLTGLHCIKYVNDRCIVLRNDTLLQEDSDGALHPTQLSTPADICAALHKHFPEIPADMAERAVKNWTILKEKAKKGPFRKLKF